MEVFVARQPIFDGEQDVFGYELSFRSGFEAYYQALQSDTSDVDLLAYVNFGELTAGKKGFVTFPKDLLLMELPILFPCDTTVAVIPGQTEGDEETLARCRDLKDYGYPLAVEGPAPQLLSSPYLEVADLAMVDFADTSAEDRQAVCEELKAKGKTALARNVGQRRGAVLRRDFRAR